MAEYAEPRPNHSAADYESVADAHAGCVPVRRYGLQHLSDQVLGDMCASTCHHAAAGLLPARWYACFCALGPAVKPTKQQRLLGPWQLPACMDTVTASSAAAAGHAGMSATDAEALLGSAAAADFWVFCACQLAYPNSVVALFPEAQEALPLVRSALVMESLKAAFRLLGDPSGQTQFMADKLGLAVAADAAVGVAAAATAAGPGTRPSTSSSKGVCYDAWALLDLLMAEWLSRAWARAQDMARLRRCVSS